MLKSIVFLFFCFSVIWFSYNIIVGTKKEFFSTETKKTSGKYKIITSHKEVYFVDSLLSEGDLTFTGNSWIPSSSITGIHVKSE